jgi:hypothetical protein
MHLHLNMHVWQLAKTTLSFVEVLTPHGVLNQQFNEIHQNFLNIGKV